MENGDKVKLEYLEKDFGECKEDKKQKIKQFWIAIEKTNNEIITIKDSIQTAIKDVLGKVNRGLIFIAGVLFTSTISLAVYIFFNSIGRTP